MKATITKTQNAQPSGQYRPTEIDERKAICGITIEAWDGDGRATIRTKASLRGRGIRYLGTAPTGVARYLITERALDALRADYDVMGDF